MDSQAIAKWAEGQTKPAHTPAYKRLTQEQIIAMLDLRKLGKTQVEIAETLGCDQASVSRALRQFTDTTEQATAYLRGKALHMAKNVVKTGQARDHIQALKGLNVLAEDGRDLKIAIGINLPGLTFASPAQEDSVVIHSVSDATGSDN